MREIYNKKWYTPMEIAKQHLIENRRGDKASISGNYSFVLALIKSGHLRAKNYSNGSRPFWLVSEDEITRYHDALTKSEP